MHNIAQNRPDNFPSYPPDNHHCSDHRSSGDCLEGKTESDDVYLREGGDLVRGVSFSSMLLTSGQTNLT